MFGSVLSRAEGGAGGCLMFYITVCLKGLEVGIYTPGVSVSGMVLLWNDWVDARYLHRRQGLNSRLLYSYEKS